VVELEPTYCIQFVFLPVIAGFGLRQPGRYAAFFLKPSTTFG